MKLNKSDKIQQEWKPKRKNLTKSESVLVAVGGGSVVVVVARDCAVRLGSIVGDGGRRCEEVVYELNRRFDLC